MGVCCPKDEKGVWERDWVALRRPVAMSLVNIIKNIKSFPTKLSSAAKGISDRHLFLEIRMKKKGETVSFLDF
jgi:hypothetical protein